jgi:hypothetical protein
MVSDQHLEVTLAHARQLHLDGEPGAFVHQLDEWPFLVIRTVDYWTGRDPDLGASSPLLGMT